MMNVVYRKDDSDTVKPKQTKKERIEKMARAWMLKQQSLDRQRALKKYAAEIAEIKKIDPDFDPFR